MFQKQNLQTKRKLLDFTMKIMLNAKRLYPIDSVKYLGVKNKLN